MWSLNLRVISGQINVRGDIVVLMDTVASLFQSPDPGYHVAYRALEILMRCHNSRCYRRLRVFRNL